MTEPQLGDTVQYGYDRPVILVFSEDDGTYLSNGRWICASHLTSTGDREWLYTPKIAEDMTVAELIMEHRHSTRAVLTNQIGRILTSRVLPEVTKLLNQATEEAVEYVMDTHYRTPPRLMGKDTTQGDSPP